MNKQKIQEWIDNAELKDSIIYYTGHLVEDINRVEIREGANIFRQAAERGIIDLFQNKIKEGDQSQQPVYEYIARKKKGKKEI
jgi:hypothetical protein